MKILAPLLAALAIISSFAFSAAQGVGRSDAGATYVRIQTSAGDIDIELNTALAPLSSENFITYAEAGYYDRLIVHRVVQGVLIQSGGYSKSLYPRATRDPIKSESANGLLNIRGTIAMARQDDPDSAKAQFFINLADNDFLDRTGGAYKKDAGYTVFGHVVGGMNVADTIGAVATGSAEGGTYFAAEVPVETVLIKRIDVISADDVLRNTP